MTSRHEQRSIEELESNAKLQPLRRAKILLSIIIACFILASMFILSSIMQRQQALGTVSRYNTAWLASQAVAEFVRLEQRLSAFEIPNSGTNQEEVKLRFEILVNRAKLLSDGEFQEFANRYPEVQNFIRQLEVALLAIEPIIEQLDSAGNAQRALEIMMPLDAKLTALASAANQFGAERVASDQRELIRLHWLLTSLIGGLIACGIAFIGLLVWQNTLLDRLHVSAQALAKQLKTETFFLETTLETIDQGLVVFDSSGAARIHNRRAADLLGMQPEDIQDASERDLVEQFRVSGYSILRGSYPLHELLASDASRRQANLYELAHPNGSCVEVRTASLPEGGSVCTYTDTTARRAADLAKDSFLATMSHEIRTPLTALLGVSDLMASESLSSQHHEYVAMMQRSGRHLLLVVNDILDFSRIEAGRLELEHTAFAIKELVEELRQLMTPRAHERGLRLVFELSDSVPSGVVGDRTRLAQILINLIDNAVKFTGEGQITVRLSAQELSEGRVRLRFDVIDTGPGIPQEYQSCLFEPFTQADNSTTRRFGGSGLGLAISKRLIDIMGGAIGVESSLGKGSHFWFQLVTEAGVPVRRAENFAFEYHKVNPKRVLLVEDVEVNRRLLGEVLRRQGHEVVIATNGAEALELVRRRDIDVVLMDVQMPVMDGVEATRRIRELGGESGNVRIIGLTAYVLQGKREECLRAGMDAVLIKPLDWHALLSVLNDEPVSIVRETAVLGERAYPAQTFEPSSVLNVRVIADWRERLAPLAWSELIQSVLRDARDTFEVMRSLPKGSRELAEVAHQLKGTSGFVGFEKLSILAGELERVAKAGDDGAGLVDKIGAALMATTIELQGSGDVNPSATVTRMVVETDPADLIS